MRKSVAASTSILQVLTILSAGGCLVSCVVYGPGRGMTLWGVDSALQEMLKTVIYALFLFGALSFPGHRVIAVCFLALGMGLRIYLELEASVLKQTINLYPEITAGWIFTDVVFYLATFIFPALLLMEAIRCRKQDA